MNAATGLQLSGIGESPGQATGRAFLFQGILERKIRVCAIERNQVGTQRTRIEEANSMRPDHGPRNSGIFRKGE